MVRCTVLNFVIPSTMSAPLTCRFGMVCSCIVRSHATPTEGTFCSVAESCDLILRHTLVPLLGGMATASSERRPPPKNKFFFSVLLSLSYPVTIGRKELPGYHGWRPRFRASR